MIVGDKQFGVVSYVIMGGLLPQKMFVFFHPYDCISCVF